MRLSKEQSRERWAQVRSLWFEWDPIGVMSLANWPRDEYDAYLGPTLRLLESNASEEELIRYLTEIELGHMGLSESEQASSNRSAFAKRLREWYDAQWPQSSV
ncbi:MAG TPA: hypothetical protein VFS24_04545 [Steroidobacteraceae bacterium]|nr:hypothetical protein [Steroidobacteraceae bacterium]